MSTTGTNGMPRRSFITTMALGGVGASLAAAGSARAAARITAGDAAILRFLAAAELLEADLWQQYAELANNNPAYQKALLNIDPDMVAYIQQNTNDEISHQAFLNDFLISQNLEPVDLDAFRNLPSSQATGAEQIGRLTNLMNLNVDTSWYLRYRSSGNPDFGNSFGQVATIKNRPAIPLQRQLHRQPDPGHREHGGLPLRHYRAGGNQPVPRTESECDEPGGPEDRHEHRPLGGMAPRDLGRHGRGNPCGE